MTIEPITYEELSVLYETRLKVDFPPTELRPLSNMKMLLDKGAYRCFACRDGEKILAYALFAVAEGAALLDYYAVDKSLRGQGIGGEFLKKLQATAGDFGAPYLLIEAESLESAANKAETAERERRLRFYHRCGCVSTGVYSHLFWVEYEILALPLAGGCPPTAEQAKEALESVYRLIVTLPPGRQRDEVCKCYFKEELYPDT